MSQHPAAADTDEQQNLPQCRICLDGPDPDLGRLIRPCLCSGTVSVRGGGPALSSPPTRARANSTCSFGRTARTPRLSSAMEEHLGKRLGFLRLSAMSLPLSLCTHQDCRPRHQPRFVSYSQHPSPLTPIFFFCDSAMIPPTSPLFSRDRHSIYNPVHDHSLRVVFPSDHLALLVGRSIL